MPVTPVLLGAAVSNQLHGLVPVGSQVHYRTQFFMQMPFQA
jgi:hypothetical protein